MNINNNLLVSAYSAVRIYVDNGNQNQVAARDIVKKTDAVNKDVLKAVGVQDRIALSKNSRAALPPGQFKKRLSEEIGSIEPDPGSGVEKSDILVKDVINEMLSRVMDEALSAQDTTDGKEQSIFRNSSFKIPQGTSFLAKGFITDNGSEQMGISVDLSTAPDEQQDATRIIHLGAPLEITVNGKLPRLDRTHFRFVMDNNGDENQVSLYSKGYGVLFYDAKGNGLALAESGDLQGEKQSSFLELTVPGQHSNNDSVDKSAFFHKWRLWNIDDNNKKHLVCMGQKHGNAIFLCNGRFSPVSSNDSLEPVDIRSEMQPTELTENILKESDAGIDSHGTKEVPENQGYATYTSKGLFNRSNHIRVSPSRSDVFNRFRFSENLELLTLRRQIDRLDILFQSTGDDNEENNKSDEVDSGKLEINPNSNESDRESAKEQTINGRHWGLMSKTEVLDRVDRQEDIPSGQLNRIEKQGKTSAHEVEIPGEDVAQTNPLERVATSMLPDTPGGGSYSNSLAEE